MYWNRFFVYALAFYYGVMGLCVSSLFQQIVVEFDYPIAKSQALTLYYISYF